MLVVAMCGFLYGYMKQSDKSFYISGPSLKEVMSGQLCLGKAKYVSGDVSGDEVFFTMNVTEEQCRSACGLQQSKSWAHSTTGECLCGNSLAVHKADSDYKSGNCAKEPTQIASN